MTLLRCSTGRRLAAGLLIVGLFLSGGMPSALAAALTVPSASDRQVTLAVTSLLKREHLLRHPPGQGDFRAVPEDVPSEPRPNEGLFLPVRHRRVQPI